MAGGAMVWTVVQNVGVLLTALLALIGLVAAVDRFVGGRLRGVLEQYLRVRDLREMAEENGKKLDRLHQEHRTTMAIDHDLAAAHNDLAQTISTVHNLDEEERPLELDVEGIRQRAEQAGTAWPGQFLREPGERVYRDGGEGD